MVRLQTDRPFSSHTFSRWEEACGPLASMLEDVQNVGEKRLAIAYFPVNIDDPFSLMEDGGLPDIVWSNSRDGSVLVGYGNAAIEGAGSSDAATSARDWYKKFGTTRVLRKTHDRDGLPFIFWGGRFGGTASVASHWQQWPDLSMRIPELTVYKRVTEQRTFARVALWLSPEMTVNKLRSRVEKIVSYPARNEPFPQAEPATENQIFEESREEWMGRVNGAVTHIRTGALQKVVAARCERVSPPHNHQFSPVATLMKLREKHPMCTVFGFLERPNQLFLGATPETLLRIKNGEVFTHALAGTTGRGLNAAEDMALGAQLLSSAKEREEHALVVRAVEEALSGGVEDLSYPATPRLLRLSRVQHLVTDFKGRLSEEAHPLDILFKLHPTPAVAGTPPEKANAWIREHEKMDRGWYAGPIGWSAISGDCAFRVALRCALMTSDMMVAFAGAGIVEGSWAEHEWEETSLKLKTMKEAAVHERRPE